MYNPLWYTSTCNDFLFLQGIFASILKTKNYGTYY